MEHLSHETLSRLVDEAPAPEERHHLACCASCAAELHALRAQTEALRSLPELRPPLGDWETLQARMVSEGLIRRPGGLSGSLAVTPPWMRGAAAVLLFLGGVAVGGAVRPGAVRPSNLAERTAHTTARTAAEAEEQVRVAEGLYIEALLQRQQFAEAEGDLQAFTDPASRYAALEYLVAAGEAAVRQVPADPFLNGFLASALAERQAVLRRISSAPDSWF